MAATRQREPKGSTKGHESAALASRLRCPNCGREPAIVFPLLGQYDKPVKDAPLVCTGCCLKPTDRL